MSAWDDFKASDLYKGDIEITDHLTNYDSVTTWSGDKATASFPQADPNDIADAPIIFNPGNYRSAERLYLLGGKYELEIAGFIDYPWQVQYDDLDNPDAVRTHGYVTFPNRVIYHINYCGESYPFRDCIEYGYGGTIECRDEDTLETWLNNLPADLREAVNAATRSTRIDDDGNSVIVLTLPSKQSANDAKFPACVSSSAQRAPSSHAADKPNNTPTT